MEAKPAGNLFLYDRTRLEITGVENVESFTDVSVVLHSNAGDLSIEGENLHIDQFSTESGNLTVTGRIDGVLYYAAKASGGFFSRLRGK